MILTVTLNASIDKRYQLASPLALHEVQRVAALTNTAGGKGLNCARAIAALGEEVLATGFVGGFNGQYVQALLKQDGVACDFAPSAHETRSCINVLDPDGASTEFLEAGSSITKEELALFEEKYRQFLSRATCVTLNGSLPQGVPTNYYAHLITLANETNTPVVLDTSGEALSQALAAGPTLIKPNADELLALSENMQVNDTSTASPLELARLLAERYHIAYVVVSLGKEGALLVHGMEAFQARPPVLTAVNPVGSGDTMVGSLAVSLSHGTETKDMLVQAVAAASANCLTEKTGSFKASDYERLQSQVTCQTLNEVSTSRA